MNSRIPPNGPELPSIIGQFDAQTITPANKAEVTLSNVPFQVRPGDPMVVANGSSTAAGSMPLTAHCATPNEIIVTLWNVSGVNLVLAAVLPFKVVLL